MPDPRTAPWSLYFDGGCDPNPGGITTYGFVVKSGRMVKWKDNGTAAEPRTPEATNNVAEYVGLIRGLEYILTLGLGETPLTVFGDSNLVIGQMTGTMKVKNPKLTPLHAQATSLVEQLGDVTFTHVYREANQEADALAKEAKRKILAQRRGKRR